MDLYIDSAFLHNIMNVLETIPVAGGHHQPLISLPRGHAWSILASSNDAVYNPSLLALSEIQKELYS